MTITEQIQKSIDPIMQEMMEINNNLNQKYHYYMNSYGKSLDFVGEIMSIANEAYSENSEMTTIEMANKMAIIPYNALSSMLELTTHSLSIIV